MHSGLLFNDEYEHQDDSIEYVLENVLCDDDKTEEYLFIKDLFNSVLTNFCSCKNKYKKCTDCDCGSNYIKDGSKTVLKNLEQTKPIYECFSLCSCDMGACNNRVVQFGPRKNLKVGYSKRYHSNGLITNELITKGEFICEYVGEILTKIEAQRRIEHIDATGKMNYIICLKEKSNTNEKCFFSIIIDPSRKGNIGRYLNHSCEANCQLFSVRVGCPIPKIAIFAARSICEGEELCIDYGSGCKPSEKVLNQNFAKKVCKCGTKKCKGFMPSFTLS